MKQTEMVLDYIKRHGSITAWEAMRELRIMRLASRINELRNAGFPIYGIMQYKRTQDGVLKKWKVYYLKNEVEK